MNRLSILHQLPYWQDLLITSLLDPMHIFKNVGQTIWDHFIGIKDKGGWREDLKECHKEHLLHRGPIWSFTKQEDEQVKSVIKSFRTPTGHMHCLKGAFTHDNRLSGLKTHDWHKMLQYILPIAIKGCLTPEIRQVIYKLSRLVRWISQKEISHESIEENRIKWRQRYDEERHNVEQERTAYRATCGQHIGLSNIQYPTHLKMLPKYMSLNWLDDALQNAARQGEQVTEEEREFARVEM